MLKLGFKICPPKTGGLKLRCKNGHPMFFGGLKLGTKKVTSSWAFIANFRKMGGLKIVEA